MTELKYRNKDLLGFYFLTFIGSLIWLGSYNTTYGTDNILTTTFTAFEVMFVVGLPFVALYYTLKTTYIIIKTKKW